MSSNRVNLNTLVPKHTGNYDWGEQARSTPKGNVTIHFGDVASAAEAFIRDSPMIVGCVAWVRSKRLVAVLAERPVALVVNKEFGLRVSGHPEREALMPLQGGVPSKALPEPQPREATLEAVRCAGWAAKGRFGALMHHKFLVRLTKAGKPTAVFSGSFNLSAGAENNIENAFEIHDPTLAAAFLAEFTRVSALSEPLNFKAGTPAPGSNATTPVKVKRAPAKRKPAARKKTGVSTRKAAPAKRKTTTTPTKKKTTTPAKRKTATKK